MSNELSTNAKQGQSVEVVNAAGEFDRTATVLGVKHEVLLQFNDGTTEWTPVRHAKIISDDEKARRDEISKNPPVTKDLTAVDEDTRFAIDGKNPIETEGSTSKPSTRVNDNPNADTKLVNDNPKSDLYNRNA